MFLVVLYLQLWVGNAKYLKIQLYLLHQWLKNHSKSITLLKLFSWIIFDPFVLVLKPQLAQLRENHQMSMLILCDTAYLKKGNFYGIILTSGFTRAFARLDLYNILFMYFRKPFVIIFVFFLCVKPTQSNIKCLFVKWH